MKTYFFPFFIFLIVSSTGFAQFPQCLMPGNVFGKIDDDTLLNTRRVLLNSGIKKIYARQTHRGSAKISKTTVINKSGNIELITACFSKVEPAKDGWCVFDTIVYDHHDRISEIRFRDRNGDGVSQSILEYFGDNELKVISISNMLDSRSDTLTDHRYFNKKGQMVKLVQIIKGRLPETSLYYYNSDGLLDSVQYESSPLPTIVFKRNEKRKKKIIDAQIQHSKFKWVFNQSRQCTSMEIITTYPPGSNYTGIIKSKTAYRYNRNGTLSKVSLTRNDEVKGMMYYTYSK